MEAIIGILTISDTRDSTTDSSGPEAEKALRAFGFTRFRLGICKDEVSQIRAALLAMSKDCNAVFTTGGTGFSARDVTPEATLGVLDRRADGLPELMRLKGLEHTPFSHLSRGVAGAIGATLVVNLPGSPKAARQGIEAIGHLVEPILSNLGGEGCPAGDLV